MEETLLEENVKRYKRNWKQILQTIPLLGIKKIASLKWLSMVGEMTNKFKA